MDNHSVAVMIYMMTLIASIASEGEIQQSNCRSPQYLEMGREGVVECSHGQTVYGYYWYDTTDSTRNQPIIRNQNGSKSGRGFAADEYDIQNDGSLVIKSVSFDHDRVYKLLTAKRQFGETTEEDVTVIVTVRPDEEFPLIDRCSGDVSCFAQLSPQTALGCIVSNSRPAINLTWSLPTSKGTLDVSYTSRVLPSGQLFTSEVSIEEIPFQGNSLLLLECKQKRDELPSLLTETATILIQNRDVAQTIPPGAKTMTPYYQEGSSPQLPCDYSENTIAMAWKRVDSGTLAAKTRQRVFKMSEDVDLSLDGSLILPDINLRDEGVYICSTNDGESEHDVVYDVHTYVLPVQPHPLIDVCGTRKVCSSVREAGDVLACKVEGSRPLVDLTWSIRTSNGDLKMDSEGAVNNQSDGLFSSSETTTFPNLNNSFAVLSCTPSVEGDVFDLHESLLLVELVGRRPSFKKPPITKWFERDTDGTLSCSDGVYTFWKRITASANDSIAFAVNGGIYPMVTMDQSERFHMRTHGTLVLNSVIVEDEGIYMCVFGDGITESATMYDLKVFAVPSPPHLVVEGCEQQSYCVLERPSDGSVLCSVHGIRPEVKLTWTIQSGTENGATFVNHTVVRSINGETYDISLHSNLRAGRTAEKITIQCKAVGPHPELFDLSSTLDVHFSGGEVNEDSNLALLSLLLLIPLAISVFVAICIKVTCRRTNETRGLSGDETDSGRKRDRAVPDSPKAELDETELTQLNSTADTSHDQLMTDFVCQLKYRYRRWCANVHPIPGGDKHQQRSIDQIYVDNGLEVYRSHNLAGASGLQSYEDLFRLEAKRIIVEADAGYGKSSMVMKAADDWCKAKDGSPLKDVHVFILLQMKSLKDITSFYEAIVKSLLPEDTDITPFMIERLVKRRDVAVVIGLDGFDEYPGRDMESDFKSILSGDMLQGAQVVLVTRTDCLPSAPDPTTRHFRLSELVIRLDRIISINLSRKTRLRQSTSWWRNSVSVASSAIC